MSRMTYLSEMITISNNDAESIIRIAATLRGIRTDNIRQQNAIRMLQVSARKLKNKYEKSLLDVPKEG